MAREHYGAKNPLFFWWERTKAEVRYTPRRRNHRYRACWEGSYKGGGVLLGRTTAYFLVEETQRVTMMEIASSWCGKNAYDGRFLEVKPTLGVDFGNVVARTSHANVPLRRYS